MRAEFARRTGTVLIDPARIFESPFGKFYGRWVERCLHERGGPPPEED